METDGNQSNMEFMKNCLDILRIDNEYIVNAREERDNYREMYNHTYDDLVDTTKKISELTSQIEVASNKSLASVYIHVITLALMLALVGLIMGMNNQSHDKLDTIQTQIKALENNEHTK